MWNRKNWGVLDDRKKVWSKMIWKDNCSQDVVNIHLEIHFYKRGTLPKFFYGPQTCIYQPSLCIFSVYIFQTWLPYIVFGSRFDGLALLGFSGNIYILRIKGTSLAVQWLRIFLPMQGMLVRSLVRELGSHMPWGKLRHCAATTKRVHHN